MQSNVPIFQYSATTRAAITNDINLTSGYLAETKDELADAIQKRAEAKNSLLVARMTLSPVKNTRLDRIIGNTHTGQIHDLAAVIQGRDDMNKSDLSKAREFITLSRG